MIEAARPHECPVLSLIQARLLVEEAIGNRGYSSNEEISLYIAETQKSLDLLKANLNESNELATWLQTNGL